MFTTRQSISFTGVMIRDEKLVYSTDLDKGVLSYSVDDGSRLSKQSSIAKIFDSYNQIYFRYRIAKLEDEIDVLEKAQDRGTTDYAQPEFISSQISEQYKSILSNIKNKNLDNLNSQKLNLLKLMCILNVTSNVESDYQQKIDSLTQELMTLETSLVSPVSVANATESGYFTSVVDGYESELSIDGIPDMTADDIRAITASPIKSDAEVSNVIGKVFSDYTWKFVGVIDTPDRYFVNQKFDLILASLGKTYRAYVESITPTGNGNEAIVVLSCDTMDATAAAARVADAEILFGEYSGIRVPRSAIRFKDSIKGVYVMEGEKMLFKQLDVIYEGDDYVLSAVNNADGYLELYDRVLLDPVPTVGNITNDASDSKNGDNVPPVTNVSE